MIQNQRILIKKLFGVTECEFSMNQFMVLIGEQSTGKSTVCKAVYYLRKFPEIMTRYLLDFAFEGHSKIENQGNHTLSDNDIYMIIKDVRREYKALFTNIFGLSWEKPGMRIQYTYDAGIVLTVKTESQKGYLDISFSVELERKLKRYIEDVWYIYVYETNILDNAEKSKKRVSIERRITNEINKIFCMDMDTIYVPAGRSLLTLMTNQLGRLKEEDMDFINGEFHSLITSVRPRFIAGFPKSTLNDEDIQNVQNLRNLQMELMRLLKGEYRFSNGQETLLVHTEGNHKQQLALNYTSSGQQEMLWVLNLLYLWSLDGNRLFVIVEEPEAHLFPSAQKLMVEIMSRFVNITSSYILVTTHSPYILTSANNLVFADVVAKGTQKLSAVDKIAPKDTHIDNGNFAAYFVGGKPYLDSIVDHEFHEIDASRIDTVSIDINEEYSALFKLGEGEE